jgi:Rrf2 family transcriptional regulator, iron-sulfur cluster assembly transcription factor
MLSNTSKYAIRALIYLALQTDSENRIGIKKISSELKIPSPFLAKILQVLARHKILISNKGPNGGFCMGKNSSQITLYEIVTIIEGSDIFDKCLISTRSCNENSIPCPVHEKFESIRSEMKQLFMKLNLNELAHDILKQEQMIAL